MARFFTFASLVLTSCLVANPTSPTVVEGGASFSGLGTSSVTVNSTAPITAINWSQFSIANGEMVTFQRTGSSGDYYVLNTVTGGSASAINGTLMTGGSANGHIYLVNPAGITIGATGQVIAGSFLASTLDLVGSFDPLNNMEFRGASQNAVTTAFGGTVQSLTGDVTFIGYRVVNGGNVTACDTAAFAAGYDVILKPTDVERVFIQTGGTAGAGTGIDSTGIITADNIILKANGNLYSLAINHSGIMNLTACSSSNGTVKIIAERLGSCTGAVEISGIVQRSVLTGSGSAIFIDGATIAINSGAQINASGSSGAGHITIGGVLSSCPTSNVYIDSNAQILSNVSTTGTGGTIDINSTISLLSLGLVQATGISQGGSVNFLCKDYLGLDGNIDVSVASGGIMGTLLVTAGDITVSGPANYGTNFTSPTFTQSNVESVITTDGLTYALARGNVSVIADGVSDITVTDDFTWSSGSTLSLNAVGVIQVNAKGSMTGVITPTSNLVLSLTAPAIYIGQNGNTSTAPAGFLLTTGSITAAASNTLALYGGGTNGSLARLSTLSGTQTITFGDAFLLEAGTATGSDAQMVGTTVTIDKIVNGNGGMLLSANNCATAFIDANVVNIGTTVQPTNLSILAGCCSSNNEAYIGNIVSGSTINIQLTGDLVLTGGASGAGNKASILALGASGSTTTILARDVILTGGAAGSNNLARITSYGNLGSVQITTLKDILINGGSSTLGSAYIGATTVTFTSGRDVIITGGTTNLSTAYIEGTAGVTGTVARFLTLQGGSGSLASAEIRATNGDIALDASTGDAQFTFKGGHVAGASNSGAKVYVSGNGNINIGATSAPNYIYLTGGSGNSNPHAELWVQGDGNIFVGTLSDINYVGGISGNATHASAHVDGNGNITHAIGRDLNMTTGKLGPANASDVFIKTTNGYILLDVLRDMTMTGDCQIPNLAYVQSGGNNGAIEMFIGRFLLMRGDTLIWVVNGGQPLVLDAGNFVINDCSRVLVGTRQIYPVIPFTPVPVPVVPVNYPAIEYYRYTFLYELFYRLNYFKYYDWYEFHGNFWESTVYVGPGNQNHLE
jgi:mucin-19